MFSFQGLSVCACAYRFVSDNEMLHVAKKYLEGNSAVFIRLMFHWVHLLLILFRDTKTWRQILIKKAHCVSLPGNTSAVCLFCSVWPVGMKNSIYTNTVYLSQQLTRWNPWKQSLVLRNTTPAKSKSYMKSWSLKKSFLLQLTYMFYLFIFLCIVFLGAHISDIFDRVGGAKVASCTSNAYKTLYTVPHVQYFSYLFLYHFLSCLAVEARAKHGHSVVHKYTSKWPMLKCVTYSWSQFIYWPAYGSIRE